MIKELKEKFINNDYMRFVEKYKIISDFYSKDGQLLESPNNAYTQVINVSYDVIMITNGDKNEHSMMTSKFDKTKYSIVEETSSVDSLMNIIEKMITSKLTKISLSFDGPSDSIELPQNLLLKMFNFFNIIDINIGELEYNKIYLPDGDFKLYGFGLTGGTIIFPQNFIMSATTELNIIASNVYCEVSDTPNVQLVGKNINLSRLNFTQPFKITTGATYQDDADKFDETSIQISNVYYNLNGFDDRTQTPNGMFKEPLISVESNAYTTVFDVKLIGGSYRKLFKFSGIRSLSISEIYRSSKSINAYSVGLDSVKMVSILNTRIYGELVSENKTKMIEFDPSKSTIFDRISVNNIRLNNCGLASLDSLGIKEFSIYDCIFEGDVFITTKNNKTNKLTISNSKLTIDDEVFIEGNNIDFIDSVFISEKNNTTFYSKESLNIINSKILCDNKDILFKLENDCDVSVKNTDILANAYTIEKCEEDVSPLLQIIESVSTKKIKITNTNFKLGGEFKISGIDDQSYDGIRFSNVSGIKISNATSFTSKFFALDVNKTVPIVFNTVSFKSNSFASDNTPENVSFSLTDCSGEISYTVKDVNPDNSYTRTLNVSSVRSKVGFIVGSSKYNVKVKVDSTDSLGSCFYGGSNVTVVPEMRSKDIESFERVSSYMKKTKTVCYGNV